MTNEHLGLGGMILKAWFSGKLWNEFQLLAVVVEDMTLNGAKGLERA